MISVTDIIRSKFFPYSGNILAVLTVLVVPVVHNAIGSVFRTPQLVLISVIRNVVVSVLEVTFGIRNWN